MLVIDKIKRKIWNWFWIKPVINNPPFVNTEMRSILDPVLVPDTIARDAGGYVHSRHLRIIEQYNPTNSLNANLDLIVNRLLSSTHVDGSDAEETAIKWELWNEFNRYKVQIRDLTAKIKELETAKS